MPSQNNVEIDYFALHNRKARDIRVEMLDYDFVDKSSDIDELKGILALLRSGKEGRYPQLEHHTEQRILQVLPEHERKKIMRMKSGPTSHEVVTEEAELANWESTMRATNEKLLTQKSKHKASPAVTAAVVGPRKMPPVRGQATKTSSVDDDSTTTNTKEDDDESEEKSEKISAYNWRAWEKYDVDNALKEMDNEENLSKEAAEEAAAALKARAKERRKELASLPSSVNLQAMSSIERKVCAESEKQKGNECFKAGETEEALLYYTRSLAYDDTSAILYSNRALGHLKLKNFQSAEEDCTRAVTLDPSYHKAWIRRGMTRHRRGKYKEAIEDFEKALELGTGPNADLTRLLEKTRQKYKEVEGEQFNKIQIIEEDSEEEEVIPEKKSFQRIQIIEEDSQRSSVPAAANAPRFEILEEY